MREGQSEDDRAARRVLVDVKPVLRVVHAGQAVRPEIAVTGGLLYDFRVGAAVAARERDVLAAGGAHVAVHVAVAVDDRAAGGGRQGRYGTIDS